MPTLAQLNAELLVSIRGANKELLQATLIAMCESSPECLLQASSRLLVPKRAVYVKSDSEEEEEDESEEGEDEDDDSEDPYAEDDDDEESEEDEEGEDEEEAAPAPNPKKRKLNEPRPELILQARYRLCKTCDQTFDVTLNNDQACKTHDGEKEIDEEQFPDDDEIYHMGAASIDVDKDWRVEQCPEGFPWSCCDELADAEGCVVQRHQA